MFGAPVRYGVYSGCLPADFSFQSSPDIVSLTLASYYPTHHNPLTITIANTCAYPNSDAYSQTHPNTNAYPYFYPDSDAYTYDDATSESHHYQA